MYNVIYPHSTQQQLIKYKTAWNRLTTVYEFTFTK